MVLDVTTVSARYLRESSLVESRTLPVQVDETAERVRSILVLDDDLAVRNALVETMRRAGYAVASAADGEEGWNALRRAEHDLVITDHDMPRLTGLDLVRRMRACRMDLPVILVSGRMPWEEPDLARVLIPGTAMEKPFRLADLLSTVRALLY
ncbi:MAG: response regulator [Opitutaceae bacterium]